MGVSRQQYLDSVTAVPPEATRGRGICHTTIPIVRGSIVTGSLSSLSVGRRAWVPRQYPLSMISCGKYCETATSKEVGHRQGRCQVLGGPRLLLGIEVLSTIKESSNSHAW